MTYELDLTASQPTNYVETVYNRPDAGEWTIVMEGGAFYTKDLIVQDTFTGVELQPLTGYAALHTVVPAVLESRKEVCAFIHIRSSVTTQVRIKRRIIGGPLYSGIGSDIAKILAEYDLDTLSATSWGQIVGRPNQLPPDVHTHYVEDIYGLETVAYQLSGIKDAIGFGDENGFGMMYQYIDRHLNALTSTMDKRISEIESKAQEIAKGLEFHVNQIIFFDDNTDPNGLYPGIWARIPDGVIMLTANDSELGTKRRIGEGPDYVGQRFAAWVRTS